MQPKLSEMVIELIIVWILGVVTFFVLWAVLLKVIKRISEWAASASTGAASPPKPC